MRLLSLFTMLSSSSAISSRTAHHRAIHGEAIELEESEGLFSSRRHAKPVPFRRHPRGWNRICIWINIAFLSCNILLFWSSMRRAQAVADIGGTLTYSPAMEAIRYQPVVFSSAFGIQRSPFQGRPSEANNKLWEDLYDFGISRITAEEARPMQNKTLPIPDEVGGYIVQLAVFHQLHCLNRIRHGIYGSVDMTNQDDSIGIEHLDHCIDIIRQGIMCSSDVTPLTFAREDHTRPMKAVAEVVHTCRDFAQLQLWALDRRIQEDVDKYKIVTDDPLGWGAYEYSPS